MKVVVVGAGYAGTIAANRLAKKVKDAEITVVNPRPTFVERVRLHEQISGTGEAATPLASMLAKGITVRVGDVEKIVDGNVTLAGGGGLDYDYLFLAVGSTGTPIDGSIAVGTWEGATQSRAALDALPAGSTVTVIGGGLTGIETASEIAESHPDLCVRLVAETVGASLSAGAQKRVHAALDRMNVEITRDSVRAVDAGPNGAVHFRSGAALDSDLTLWAVVDSVPDLAARSGLQVDPQGRAVVDEFLRSVSDLRIFVVGDCAAVPGARLGCATASPQGAHAADTLARMIKGCKPKPYSMGYVGQVLSLGRKNAVVQASRRDDRVRRLYVTGRLAAITKELVCRYAKYGPRTAIYVWLPGERNPSSAVESHTSV
ncbi:NAD(P)/FAD-dependent oxidoreductase [Rhodococcus sp. OK302]|uniref:NAD(P)/FAD-dependent oxidoreductase n=1 Tax=Rhodococcus sp. OK302 TaxID=1882769 RepID=UPI000B93CF11|nr:FAD-dependent oxidoreductase [Rhodococcus sp. OK302]OYD61286.1 NADH dehydrogenase FAD-containing subunit [Rhodococcus sp. OK302]